MLQRYGMGIGTKLLASGNARAALPYLIRPVNYWRTVEYQLVLDHAGFAKGEDVLDIGSPKLLGLYLADQRGVNVTLTDVDSYFVARCERIRKLQRIPPERLRIQVEDGRSLSFANESFDKVYSISVVEHIPDDGDSACLQEIARVLRPGGRAVLTVPFSPVARTDYIAKDKVYWTNNGHSKDAAGGQAFYQRRYTERELYERLIAPSGLRTVTVQFVGDTLLASSDKEFSDYLPAISGPLQPLMSRLFHTAPTTTWRELKKPLCALLVLAKEPQS